MKMAVLLFAPTKVFSYKYYVYQKQL